MDDSEAARSLYEILARSSPKSPAPSPAQHGSSITPAASVPTSPVLCTARPTPLALEYPFVNVPGSSTQATPPVTPSRSPKSIFGTALFGFPKSAPGMTPSRSRSNSHGGGLFSSLWSQKPWGNGKDRVDGAKDTSRTPKQRRSLSSSSSPCLTVGGSSKELSGLAPIFHSESPAMIADGGASTPTENGASPRPWAKRNRTISWADQLPIRPAPSSSTEVDFGGAQTTHGSAIAPLFAREDSDSDPSSSTLSLNSPFSSDLSLVTQSLPPEATIAGQQGKDTMSVSPHDLSPFKGKPLWEPDDEEWADMDANHISSTYKASFRDPGRDSPRKTTDASTLSRFTSTITSLLPSSSAKLAAEARLRDEEELRDKSDELGNTYYSDPAGDLHDTVMTSTFLSGSRYFHHDQAGSSARVPHVINLERYFNTEDPLVGAAYPRLCSAVATILSHTSRECVEAFLDPRVEEFVYRREVERSAAGNILVIRRMGNKIIAGSYRNQGFSLSWTLYVRASFSATGLWHETYASPVAGFSPINHGVPIWDTFVPSNAPFPLLNTLSLPTMSSHMGPLPVVPSKYSTRKLLLANPLLPPMQMMQRSKGEEKEEEEEEEGEGDEGTIDPTDEKFVLYQSRSLARFFLRDIWVRLEGRYECKATWEADGVVREVRLRSALVGFAGDGDDDG